MEFVERVIQEGRKIVMVYNDEVDIELRRWNKALIVYVLGM